MRHESGSSSQQEERQRKRGGVNEHPRDRHCPGALRRQHQQRSDERRRAGYGGERKRRAHHERAERASGSSSARGAIGRARHAPGSRDLEPAKQIRGEQQEESGKHEVHPRIRGEAREPCGSEDCGEHEPENREGADDA